LLKDVIGAEEEDDEENGEASGFRLRKRYNFECN
jgi:hypothetical protein